MGALHFAHPFLTSAMLTDRVMPFWPTGFLHVVPLCLLVVLCISPVAAITPTMAGAASTQFLEQYAANPDVTELYYGLLYKVINEGNNIKPGPQTQCQVHYEGRLLENLTKDRAVPADKPFDSSYKNGAPSEFAPSHVMTCLREAMQLMGVGSKWELVCPPELAYGKWGVIFQEALCSCTRLNYLAVTVTHRSQRCRE